MYRYLTRAYIQLYNVLKLLHVSTHQCHVLFCVLCYFVNL
jgi:hypothetical protein